MNFFQSLLICCCCDLQILSPQLDPLTEQQLMAVYNLQQSSQQAEDALSQGLDKLQQTLAETIASDPLDASGVANYMGQMTQAMGKLDALESFVNQVIFHILSSGHQLICFPFLCPSFNKMPHNSVLSFLRR